MGVIEMPAVPDARCCGYYGPPGSFPCECAPSERALRAWSGGYAAAPMTVEQREWCLGEIGRVEGWTASDHTADTDADLARNVMSAWTDYCRDKGLL